MSYGKKVRILNPLFLSATLGLIVGCGQAPKTQDLSGASLNALAIPGRPAPQGPVYNGMDKPVETSYINVIKNSSTFLSGISKLEISVDDVIFSEGMQYIMGYPGDGYNGYMVFPTKYDHLYLRLEIQAYGPKNGGLPIISVTNSKAFKARMVEDNGVGFLRMMELDSSNMITNTLTTRITSQGSMKALSGDFDIPNSERNIISALKYGSASPITSSNIRGYLSAQGISVNVAPGYVAQGPQCNKIINPNGGLVKERAYDQYASEVVDCKVVSICPDYPISTASLESTQECIIPTIAKVDPTKDCILPTNLAIDLAIGKNNYESSVDDYKDAETAFTREGLTLGVIEGGVIYKGFQACASNLKSRPCAAAAAVTTLLFGLMTDTGRQLNDARTDVYHDRSDYNKAGIAANNYWKSKGCTERSPYIFDDGI